MSFQRHCVCVFSVIDLTKIVSSLVHFEMKTVQNTLFVIWLLMESECMSVTNFSSRQLGFVDAHKLVVASWCLVIFQESWILFTSLGMDFLFMSLPASFYQPLLGCLHPAFWTGNLFLSYPLAPCAGAEHVFRHMLMSNSIHQSRNHFPTSSVKNMRFFFS